jgi:hypothetical protein
VVLRGEGEVSADDSTRADIDKLDKSFPLTAADSEGWELDGGRDDKEG